MSNRKMRKKRARARRQQQQMKKQSPEKVVGLAAAEKPELVKKKVQDSIKHKQNDRKSAVVKDKERETLTENDQRSVEDLVVKDDGWSEVVEEVEKARDEGEEKKVSTPRKKEILEIEVDELEGKRRRGKSWIWWLVGLVLVGIVAGAAVAAVNVARDDEAGQTEGETEKEPENAEGAGEEKAEEDPEKKTEEHPEEKPAEQPEEKPIEQPKPEEKEEKSTQPIQPRPNEPVEVPEVIPGSRLIALTFDDGPSVATTPRLLDILQQRGVKATFFVLGTMAQRAPDILRREKAEGHEVASHTPYHNQLTKLSFDQIRAEAAEMDRIFTEILGTVPPFTRPPYGSQNATVGQALGQPMVLWSIDPRDWADRNASVVCNRVVGAARDGAIILVHDIHATTVDAVPCIIDSLRAQGYEFLTVSELAAARGVTMVNGVAYYSF